MGFMSFMILVWNHIITLGDEVRIGLSTVLWSGLNYSRRSSISGKAKKDLVSCSSLFAGQTEAVNCFLVVWLFFINRYLTPFGFIINLFGERKSKPAYICGLNVHCRSLFVPSLDA